MMLFADRVHHHTNGALSDQAAMKRWDALSKQIALAIHGEAARWGDTRGHSYDVHHWQRATSTVRRAMSNNGARLIEALRSHALYPAIDPPVLNRTDTCPGTLTIESDHPVLFTLDGSDPRTADGTASTFAQRYKEPVPIDPSSIVNARALQHRIFSARRVSAPVEEVSDLQRAVIAFDQPDLSASAIESGPDGDFSESEVVRCSFVPRPRSGDSAKFHCLKGEDRLKVKYFDGDPRNLEPFTEVAATRLFWTLGFPADRMYPVKAVQCQGCEKNPFRKQQRATKSRTTFPDVAIERRLRGKRMPGSWSWTGMFRATSGPRRAQLEALALLATLVQQTNPKKNQNRLQCLRRSFDRKTETCRTPVILIDDLGAAFGNRRDKESRPTYPRGSLARFASSRVFAKKETCELWVKTEPNEVRHISEAGRRFLAARLERLDREKVRAIFSSARMGRASLENPLDRKIVESLREEDEKNIEERLVDRWTDALLLRIEEIKTARCPS